MRKIDTIEAVDESGAPVEILVFDKVQLPLPSDSGPTDGSRTRSFKLSRGGLVRPVRENAWRVVETGELLLLRE
jgi:hypothetical protein